MLVICFLGSVWCSHVFELKASHTLCEGSTTELYFLALHIKLDGHDTRNVKLQTPQASKTALRVEFLSSTGSCTHHFSRLMSCLCDVCANMTSAWSATGTLFDI